MVQNNPIGQATGHVQVVTINQVFTKFTNVCYVRYQQLIKDNLKEIARLITREQGKTLADAEGDVMRGLQVVENLCANTSLLLGENLTGISKDMDLTSYRVPLGVCAGIAPFNFPAMIPLWMFPTGKYPFYTQNKIHFCYVTLFIKELFG